jgi:hypothetical protein
MLQLASVDKKYQILLILSVMFSGIMISATYFISGNNEFKNNVEEKIFNECFDYYAESQKEAGIDISNIDTCILKASEWSTKLF